MLELMRKQKLTPISEDKRVRQAAALTLAAHERVEAAKSETVRLRNFLEPSPDFTEEITPENVHEALSRLVPQHRSGITKEQLAAMTAYKQAMAAEEAVRRKVKAELKAAVQVEAQELLPELRTAVEECIAITAQLEQLGRVADLSDDVLGLPLFSPVCGVVHAGAALHKLQQRVEHLNV
jgi:hypothetical protein